MLNGKNYLKWSQLVRTVLKKKKMEDQPSHGYRAETGRSLEAWDEEDYDYGVAMEFYNSGD